MIEPKKYPTIGDEYRHYKGGTYIVITLCEHSETHEKLVIYKSVEFGTVYARPLSMWFDKVEFSADDDKSYKPTVRFVRIK